MQPHNTAWLPVAIIFFIFWIGGIAESQAPLKDPIAAELSEKKWKVIDGFRSAKFGMNKKQVLKAIAKDFKVPRKSISISKTSDKTYFLSFKVPNLLEIGGTASLGYVMENKSNRLRQINVIWGLGASKDVNPQAVVDVSNLLRSHLLKKRYKKEGFIVNRRADSESIIIFQGLDKKDRMVRVILNPPTTKKGGDKKKNLKNVALQISFVAYPRNSD
jgi:hypothetical protein